MRKSSPTLIRDVALILTIVAVFIAIVRPAIVAAQSTSSSQPCIINVQQFQAVMLEYASNYDEHFPPFASSLQLAKAIQPYARGSAHSSPAYLLRCPVTQRPYNVNYSVSGISLFSPLPDGVNTILIQDAVPHTDGKSTVDYMSDVVTYGGVDITTDPNFTCILNSSRIVFAMEAYSQDYDERFPVYQNYSDLQRTLFPYARDNTIFTCPITSQPYVVNKSVSGKLLSDFPTPKFVKTIQDARPHPDGKITTVSLAGYTTQQGQ